mmetsp:Transcript_28874/g.60851  ORF Transcript_28874/g.60851 Transcript_28874/m.60851 type:complete len:124 (+) Transcript_28874:80-451(+)
MSSTAATETPTSSGRGKGIGAEEGEKQLTQEIVNVIDTSVEECHSEVSLVLESQQELQKSLHRLGGEVQKIFQRLPRSEVAGQTAKIPVLRRRCQRLGTKVKDIQERLSRIATIAESIPSENA